MPRSANMPSKDAFDPPPPSMFEQGTVLLMQLQHLAHALRHHNPQHGALLRAVIMSMRIVRECVNSDLADEFDCDSNSSNTMANKTSIYVSKLIQRCQDEAGITCPDAAAVHTNRSSLVDREMEAIKDLMNTPFSLQTSTLDTLRRVIQHLRHQEETRPFHVQLRACQLQLSTSYDVSSFAYGSTPLFTWIDLFRSRVLVDCIARIKESPQQHASACTVFGSSAGSLVFFTSLICGIRVQGIEILPFLVDTSTDTQRRFLMEERLLVLTSQCWEAGLIKALVNKLEKELPPLALVLDYTAALSSAGGFTLVQSTTGVVSWNKSHTFNVYRNTAALHNQHDG
ncbi:hypothetical protein AaE_010239 [Aphanomyces astaci]|uniref:Uncharacterized protein n=1 Tax=Aphanomyces astaci TaxID=112090 RepID=A0A6A5AA43_APHAT|nr:hypothetical protein AaE_010239 [Aphanomyces astaci]